MIDIEKRRTYNRKYRESEKYQAWKETNKEKIKNDYKDWVQNNRDKRNSYDRKWNRTTKGRFHTAQRQAKKRNKTFTISYDEFCSIIIQSCFYCSNKMGNIIEAGSGLDRLDSSIGYELNNVVSCCELLTTLVVSFCCFGAEGTAMARLVPSLKMFLAALTSLSIAMPQASQLYILSDNFRSNLMFPQPQHIFDVLRGLTSTIDLPALSALYFSMATKLPQEASCILLLLTSKPSASSIDLIFNFSI